MDDKTTKTEPPLVVDRAFVAHPRRAAAVNELHARPFQPIDPPFQLFQFAFLTTPGEAARAREDLLALIERSGAPPMPAGARHHRFRIGGLTLRYEQHTEFTSYGFVVPADDRATSGAPPAAVREVLSDPPGQLVVASRLDLRRADGPATAGFDATNLCAALIEQGAALIVTDFRPDAAGFTRFVVEDRGLTPVQAGAVAQLLLEIETYRTFALLGLPEAQSIGPSVRAIEEQLARITGGMREAARLAANRKLLDELAELAAESEALAAATSYRFSATRAYAQLVAERLGALDEHPFEGHPTPRAFLDRRMQPALRTCQAMEARLQDVSHKLTRATNLLRARVDVEIETQNSKLLASMDQRARLQLRLQQTVEGLSVAAVSYYIVGLIGYLAKGGSDAGLVPFAPGIATALAVPVVMLGVWSIVRRVRRRHHERERS